MDVIKTYIPKRYRSKKLVNSISGSGGTTVINSGRSELSPSAFVDSDTFYSMFEYDAVNDAIRAKKEFYSIAGITAYGTGTVGGGSGGGGATVYNGLDSTDISLALSAAQGKILNDGKLNRSEISSWALASVKPVYAISEITGLSTALLGKSDTTHQHTISQITDFAHVHQWSAIENKPTTLSGYGITDAVTIDTWQYISGRKVFTKSARAIDPSGQPIMVNGIGPTSSAFGDYAGIGFHNPGISWANLIYDGSFRLLNADFSSYQSIHALSFVKSGGTATQFLMADGSSFDKPTTLAGYGITDALLASAYTASDVLTKLKTVDGSGTGLDADLLDGKHSSYFCDYDERTLGYNVNYNTISYDFQNKSFIVSPVHSKNFTGQTNYPFDDYGQMITFGGLNTVFPFQLAVSENATKVKIRSKHRPTNNTVIDAAWADVYTSNSANRTDVDWAAKNMTVQTDIITNFKTWTKDSSKSLKSFLDKFDIDTAGNLVVKTNLYSTGEVTAYSSGTGVSGLKLMGDLDANGKSINNATSVQGGIIYIRGNEANAGLEWDYGGDSAQIASYMYGLNKYVYAGGAINYQNSILDIVGQVKSTEFKFGNYSFKQSANGLSICFNGVEQAYITNTGQYVNS